LRFWLAYLIANGREIPATLVIALDQDGAEVSARERLERRGGLRGASSLRVCDAARCPSEDVSSALLADHQDGGDEGG
jgi:hypothetical protein